MYKKMTRNLIRLFMVGVFLASASVHANVVNPSFESSLAGWTASGTGEFGKSTSFASSTDGIRSAYIFSKTGCANNNCGVFSFANGDYGSISQSVDFTSIDSVIFDSELHTAPGNPAWQSIFEAVVLIDSTLVWSANVLGTFLNQTINTTSFSGNHTLDFRVRAIGSGVDAHSNHFHFDNIRTTGQVPEPVTAALLALGLVGLGFRRKNPAA